LAFTVKVTMEVRMELNVAAIVCVVLHAVAWDRGGKQIHATNRTG
jgi:hypothetical protein